MSSRPVVLCNAGPLITLGKLNRLELLVELYGEVLIQAYHKQILTLAQTELLIREISARRDIWISGKLCEQVLSAMQGTVNSQQ